MGEYDNNREIGFHGEAGELYMLSKKERVLLRSVLSVAMESEAAKDHIVKKLGTEFVQIGENLLKEMGG